MNLKDYKEQILAQKISILKQQNNINLRLKVEELVAFGRFPYSQGRLNSKDKIINQENLKQIYDIDIPVSQIDAKKICIYF